MAKWRALDAQNRGVEAQNGGLKGLWAGSRIQLRDTLQTKIFLINICHN
jgi:hypothetical protein